MKRIGITIFTLILLGLFGCSQEGPGKMYDSLMVVDGEGKKYVLIHHIGNAYFVYPITENLEINNKLKNGGH